MTLEVKVRNNNVEKSHQATKEKSYERWFIKRT